MWGNSKSGRGVISVTTLIAQGTTIRGNIAFSGVLHVDGVVEGSLQADGNDATLTLSERGRIHGEISVPNAVINGAVVGNLHIGNRLELANAARVEGDIHYRVLEMSAGAQINGKMIYRSEAPRQLAGPDADAAIAEPA